MPLVVPRYTLQDLDAFPDDGVRYELLDGVLLVTPAPGPLHQLVVSRINASLTRYLGSCNLAYVFSPGVLEVEPNLRLEPDILVIPSGEPSAGIGADTRWTAMRRWWLAVEVSGAGSRPYDRDHKTPAYLALGVREVWRVDLRGAFPALIRSQPSGGPRRPTRNHRHRPHGPRGCRGLLGQAGVVGRLPPSPP